MVDTDATRLAKGLREIGLYLYYKTTVGDDEARITEVFNLALDRSDVIITSGGIGPTVDEKKSQLLDLHRAAFFLKCIFLTVKRAF